MFPARRVATLGCVTALTVLLAAPRTTAQSRSTLQTIAAGSPQAIRDWDAVTASMLRTGELRGGGKKDWRVEQPGRRVHERMCHPAEDPDDEP